MPIRVLCSQCETSYNLADTLAGKKIRCKKCEAIVAVPAASAPATEPAVKAAAPSRSAVEEPPPAPKAKLRPAPVEDEDLPPPPPVRQKSRPAPIEDEEEAPPPRSGRRPASETRPKSGKVKPTQLARSIMNLVAAGFMFICLGLGILGVAAATHSRNNPPDQIWGYAAAGSAGVGVFCFALTPLLSLIWLGRAWSSVPPEYGGMSGLKAVGLLFIPIFSIYWIFRVVPGLSSALTKALEARDPDGKTNAGYGAGMAALIMNFVGLFWLAWIPGLMWLSAADRAITRLTALVAADDE